jgi:hypothetical protein
MFCECECEVCEANNERIATAQETLEAEYVKKQLFMRINRLFRLVKAGAPDIVLLQGRDLIVKSILNLDPTQLADALKHYDANLREWTEDRPSLAAIKTTN